jgi:hypothetical protein
MLSIYILYIFCIASIPIIIFICYALYKECKNQHLYIDKKENTNQINYNTI